MASPDRAPIAVLLGLMIRERREALGLSQDAVARAIGRTQTWLSYVEAGKREPRLNDLDALLRELDMALLIEELPRG